MVTSPEKLASQVARRIADDVLALGWPVGTVVGSEPELLDRYQVSRAVFREAVRLVEHTGMARMRRGPGGGLVVREPDRGAVTSAAGIYLTFLGVTMDELFEARSSLEAAACRLAAERIDEVGIARLRRVLEEDEQRASLRPEDQGSFNVAVAALSGNPALHLFTEVLIQLTNAYLRGPRGRALPRVPASGLAALHRGHRRVADAIITGDAGLAQHRIRRQLGAVKAWFDEANVRRLRAAEPAPSTTGEARTNGESKLAEQVAARLRDEIQRAGWPIGEVLGSEAELLETHDVSRAVLREAIRLLEHHGVASMRRGPGGGLVVTEPERSAITRAAELILEYGGVTPAGLFEARAALEMTSVLLASQRLTRPDVELLHAALDAEAAQPDESLSMSSHAVHRQLAEAARNRPIALFVDVLSDLTGLHAASPSSYGKADLHQLAEEVHHAHRRIVHAVVSGDAELAQHRMLRHLQVMQSGLR